MPETACLHIQDQERATDTVRVVDLGSGPLRIGRAVYCDVRLTEPELADEECRLRRRGGAWQLVPIADRGSVRLDGRPVEGPITLAFGMTFQVGAHQLTLRPSPTSTPWADRPATAPEEKQGRELAAPLRADWQTRDDSHDRWDRAQKETKRWEARWRAAGEKLRAAAPATTPPPRSPATPRVVRPPVVPPVKPATLPTASSPVLPIASGEGQGVVGFIPHPLPLSRTVRQERDSARPAVFSSPLPVPQRERTRSRSRPAATPPGSVGYLSAASDERPAPPDLVRVGRPESLNTNASPGAEPNHAEPLDGPADLLAVSVDETAADSHATEVLTPRIDLTSLDGPRGEHVELENIEFEALLSRLQSLILADNPSLPESRAPEVIAFLEPLSSGAEAPLNTVLPIDDEDDDRINEPETTHPVLGVARRETRPGRRASCEEPRPPTPTTAAPLSDEFLTSRPIPEPVVASLDWTYQAPFVTDTNQVLPGEVAEPSLIAAARRPLSAPRDLDSSRQWPTVREILAAQGARPRPVSPRAAAKGRERRPEPTASREPGQWRLPFWLGWLPSSAAAVTVGIAGLMGSWAWSVDGYNAGIVAQRLADPEPSKMPLPEGVAPSAGTWWSTSATHLVQWAAYLDRTGTDAAQTRESREWLERAASVAPLNAAVRYALARPLSGETIAPAQVLARSLGQSRDVPALALAGRSLLAAGKKEPALRAFRRALEMAANADVAHSAAPVFLDDPQTRRYALPGEDLLGGVVRVMAGSDAWSYKDWSAALPQGTAAAVIAARVLREAGSADAGAALDAALADAEAASPPGKPAAEAVRLAAGAEALAMKQRWAEARDRYRQAVEQMPEEGVRRAWWFNLADLASRLDEDAERQKALEAAKVADLKDEITRRVVDLQRASGALARRTGGRIAGTVGADRESRR